MHTRCTTSITQTIWSHTGNESKLTILEELLLLLQPVVDLGVGIGSLCHRSLGGSWHAKNVQSARGARLLALEPRAQTAGVEDVIARKLLAGCCHLLTADDAHVVTRCQLFCCGIRVSANRQFKRVKRRKKKVSKQGGDFNTPF